MRNRPAEYLAQRPNFMKVAGGSFAVLIGVWLLWQFGAYGGIGWWLFLSVLAAGAGWCWSYAMWFVCGNDFQRIASGSRARQGNEKHGA
jgi:hypothetical protein